MGAAFKSAIQSISRKKQTELIAEYIYEKYDVFKRFKPLAIGIDQELIAALPQHDPVLVLRVLSTHCRRPRYIRALSRGGKRFDLNNRFKGEVTAEEQNIALQHPSMQQAANKAAPQAGAAVAPASAPVVSTAAAVSEPAGLPETAAVSETAAAAEVPLSDA